MRVLFDHQAFSIQARGGISRYVVELASRLAARSNVEVRVVAGYHRNVTLRDAGAPWALGRYVRHISKTGPLRRAVNTFISRREVRRWRPDVVHETYFRGGASYLESIANVLTLYDLTYFVFPNVDAQATRVRRLQLDSIARAHCIICISENTRQDLLRFVDVDPMRIRVVPLAGRPLNRDARLLPRPPINDPYFLHVGLRHSYKNFDLVLRAFASSPELQHRFRLVAFGGADFSSAEISRIRALGIDPTRVIHCEGDDSALASHYAHAAAFVCPSLYEGFGLPALEAMAYGCPVLSSNRGSLLEVTAGAALTFDPTEPVNLLNVMEAVTTSETLAADLRERGFKRATQFSWDRCADQTLEVYQNILVQTPERRSSRNHSGG